MTPGSPAKPASDWPDDEAASHTKRISDTTARLREWLMLPPVSGLECVDALRRGGFVIQPSPVGFADLQRDRDFVRVPLAERIDPSALAGILQRACVSPTRFVELLDE
jgi:hypothetical protein